VNGYSINNKPVSEGRFATVLIWLGRVMHFLSFIVMGIIALSLMDDPLGKGKTWALASAIALGCGALALLIGGLKLKGRYQSFFVISGPIVAAAMIVVWAWMRLAVLHVSFGDPYSGGRSGQTTRIGALDYLAVILVVFACVPALLAVLRLLASRISWIKATAITIIIGGILVGLSAVALEPKIKKDNLVANKARSEMNLEWLCRTAEQYRSSHSKYPATIAELRDFVLQQFPHSKICENPKGGSYKIVGAESHPPNNLIWIYEEMPQKGERAVVFGDEHVEMLPEKEFESKLLFAAAWSGCLDLVRELVAKNINVNSRIEDGSWPGRTPLHIAVDQNHQDVVTFLIEKGANVNEKDDSGYEPLHLINSKAVGVLLIEKGSDINTRNENGQTPLHLAAMWNHKEAAAILIEKGADLNARDNGGQTPLHEAASQSRKDVTALLLKKGADVNAKDNEGQTPLHFAASLYYKDVAEFLIENGADVNAVNNDGKTPLHIATSNGRKETTELLQMYDAKWGLFDAIKKGDRERVKQFLVKGADVNVADKYGKTPLHSAALKGYKEIAELLIAKGANIETKDIFGNTPLHEAVWFKNKDVVELLIANGADVKAKDKDGSTPLHSAAARGCKDVVELLVTKGAYINAANKYGHTPLREAEYKGYDDIVDFLRKYGAKK